MTLLADLLAKVDLPPLLMVHLTFIAVFAIAGFCVSGFCAKRWEIEALSTWASIGGKAFLALALLACVFVDGFAELARHEFGFHLITFLSTTAKEIAHQSRQQLLRKSTR